MFTCIQHGTYQQEFWYQLLHIKFGKTQLNSTLQVVRPDLKRYEDIVKLLKAKIRERRILLEEKKSVPAIQVFRHRELAQKITALTEDIEELTSEKALLINQLACADNHGVTEVKQRVASMESSLDKLDQQEGKYTAELDAALAQYAELQQQATDMDAAELDTVRRSIRSDKEREATQQLQDAYGKRFDSGLLAQSRKDVADLLDEETMLPSIQMRLHQKKQTQEAQQRGEPKHYETSR